MWISVRFFLNMNTTLNLLLFMEYDFELDFPIDYTLGPLFANMVYPWLGFLYWLRRISITFLIWKLYNCNLYTKYREKEIMCINSSSIYEIAYNRTFNISGTWVGNKIVDHEDVVGALTVGAAPATYLLSTGFNWLCKDNCKTSRETFSFCGLGPLISSVLY